MVTMVMRMTVVGVTIFSLTRNSSTMNMKITEFSPVPTSALTTPPTNPAAIRRLFSRGPKIGMHGFRGGQIIGRGDTRRELRYAGVSGGGVDLGARVLCEFPH